MESRNFIENPFAAVANVNKDHARSLAHAFRVAGNMAEMLACLRFAIAETNYMGKVLAGYLEGGAFRGLVYDTDRSLREDYLQALREDAENWLISIDSL
jgi:hypothetical protein